MSPSSSGRATRALVAQRGKKSGLIDDLPSALSGVAARVGGAAATS
jgi:hypothetical protein